MTDQRIEGAATQTQGRVQNGLGNLTGDSKLQLDGKLNEVKGKALDAYGRVIDGRAHPYFTREQIDKGAIAHRVPALLHLKDKVDAFFLHVQGSGRVRLPDGTVRRVGFAAKSGHPYTSIGAVLGRSGDLPHGGISMQSIKAWLYHNPGKADQVLWQNRSFIFFRFIDGDPALGPPGAAGVPLTPRRSLAVDRRIHGYGTPLWLDAAAPTLAIIDVSLQGVSGLELVKQMRERSIEMPILMMSMHDESFYAERALRAGAQGYVMKQRATADIATAIERVLSGDLYLSDALSAKLLRRVVDGDEGAEPGGASQLSDRELEVLQLLGHDARGAYGAEHGVRTAESFRPRVVLLDLNMPRKDGREALAELKQDAQLRRIPVVILTTSKAEEDMLRGYDLGAASYITKPVTFDSLVALMATLGKYWVEFVELP